MGGGTVEPFQYDSWLLWLHVQCQSIFIQTSIF